MDLKSRNGALFDAKDRTKRPAKTQQAGPCATCVSSYTKPTARVQNEKPPCDARASHDGRRVCGDGFNSPMEFYQTIGATDMIDMATNYCPGSREKLELLRESADAASGPPSRR